MKMRSEKRKVQNLCKFYYNFQFIAQQIHPIPKEIILASKPFNDKLKQYSTR
jgi:hypothetical protein